MQEKIVREQVPSTLTRPCKPKRRNPPITTWQSVIDRLDYTESALDGCSAQIAAIRNWSEGEPK